MLAVLTSILSLHCSSYFPLRAAERWCYPGPNVPGLRGKRNLVASHVIWRHGTSCRADLLEMEDVMLQVGKLLQLVCVSLFLLFFLFDIFSWRKHLKENQPRRADSRQSADCGGSGHTAAKTAINWAIETSTWSGCWCLDGCFSYTTCKTQKT